MTGSDEQIFIKHKHVASRGALLDFTVVPRATARAAIASACVVKQRGRVPHGSRRWLRLRLNGADMLETSIHKSIDDLETLRRIIATAVCLEFTTIPPYLTARYSIVDTRAWRILILGRSWGFRDSC
jgi:hypothetical protein